MPEDAGLLGLGEYTGRDAAPISQTAQSTVTASPSTSDTAGNPAPTPVSAPQSPPEPSSPQEPKGDLISDLSKAFATTIGEPPKTQHDLPQEPPSAKPPEKTWRDVEAPENFTKAAKESWATYKEKAKADIESHMARIKSLESELALAKSHIPEHEARVQEAQKQAQDAVSVIERVAVERSPLFKSKVIDQEALIGARLKQLVEGTGITPNEAHYLLTGDMNVREQIVENRQISTFRRQQIAEALSKWDNVQEERAKMLERGRETLQNYMREQQQQQESQRAQFLRESEKVFLDQFALAKPKLEVYNHIDGNDAWNKSADTLATVARRLYDGNVSREMVAQAAILAPAAIAYQNLLRSAYGKIQELQDQVNKYRGLQPEVRDVGGDVSQPGRILSSPNGDFVKDLVSRFRKDTGLQ